MAFLSKKEFADLCGIPTNALAVYERRKKVVLSGDFYDDTLAKNKAFLKKKSVAKKKKGVATAEPPKKEIKEVKDNKLPPKNSTDLPIYKKEPPEPKPKITDPEPDSTFLLDQEKIQLQNIQLELANEIAQIKIEKLRGDVIPTDIVRSTFMQHFKSITTSFHQGADNVLIKIAKKYDLSRQEVANYRGELISIINDCVKDAVEESKKSIQNIVNEYSQVKGVGERE